MEFIELIAIFSLIVTLVSIIVNILIVYLNNRHQEKMRKLDNAHELFKENTLHKRELFENFLESVGKYHVYFRNSGERIHFDDDELEVISKNYTILLPYIPKDILDHFNEFFNHIIHQSSANLNTMDDKFFDHIIPYMLEELKVHSENSKHCNSSLINRLKDRTPKS